jgi:hypothetical protein
MGGSAAFTKPEARLCEACGGGVPVVTLPAARARSTLDEVLGDERGPKFVNNF